MEILQSVTKILDYAIECEQNAHDFYVELANRCEYAELKDVLEGFAVEELGHKAKLESIKQGKLEPSDFSREVMDLDISDYLEDVDVEQEKLDYQSILIIAMKKEKSSYRLYSRLACMTEDQKIKEILYSLANDEAKHKLRFEIEYDDVVLGEN